jgi:diguanylate cyclase (GGDEF)-like protein
VSLQGALAPNRAAARPVRILHVSLIALGAAFAAGALHLQQNDPGPDSVDPRARILAALCVLSLGAAQVHASWERAGRESARRPWFRLYAVTGVLLFGGMAVGYLVTADEPGEFDVRVAAVPLMISLPLAGFALVKLCWPTFLSRLEVVTTFLDSLTVLAAMGVIWLQVVIPLWMVAPGDVWFEHLDQVVLYLCTSLALVLLVVGRRIGTLPMSQLVLLSASMLAYQGSDVGARMVKGADDVKTVNGAMVGYVVAAVLMVAFLHRPPIEDETERTRAVRDWVATLVPVVAALTAGLVFIVAAYSATRIESAAYLATAATAVLLLGSVAVTRISAGRELREAQAGSLERVLAERTRDGWFRALVGDSREYVFVLDADGVIIYASPRVERDVALHDTARPFERAHRHRLSEVVVGATPADLRLLLAQVALDPKRSGPYDFQLLAHEGEIDVEALIRPVVDIEFEGFVVTARDVTATRRLQSQLDTSKRHDQLTHLLSRDGFLTDLQAELDGAGGPGTVSVVVLDLERFSSLNDSLGHETGDGILRAVADGFARLPAEVVAAARLAGDAFALLVVSPDPDRAVADVLDQARSDLRGLLLDDGREVELEFRAGYVVADELEAPSAEWCLEAADLALTRARVSRQAVLVQYHEDMRAETERRVRAERLIRRALAEDGIVTYYQPIVRLDDGSARGAEALVRLRTEEGDILPPSEFVPLAEEIGLVGDIGSVVLRTACLDTARASRSLGRSLSISVNLAADQLVPSLVGEVRGVLGESGLSPRQLSLEITETTLADQSPRTQQVLRDLRALGVTIALDDFGTGYSSLSYLATLPVDGLKIDRSFVSVLGSSPSGLTLARLVVQLAEPLGLTTVAEGVETVEQADLLRGMGCSFAQGYLYSRPVPFDEYVDALIGPLATRSILDR